MPETSIDALAEDYARHLAELYPVTASEIGLPGYADKLSDYSPDGAAALDALQADVLRRLDKLIPQSNQDRVTQDALVERLTVDRQLYATGVVPLNNIASPVQDIRATFDLMPTETSEDWRNIAARLAKVDTALSGYRARLNRAVEDGLPPAQRQVKPVLSKPRQQRKTFSQTWSLRPLTCPTLCIPMLIVAPAKLLPRMQILRPTSKRTYTVRHGPTMLWVRTTTR